ncbi:MAG TPA: hypothetical protein VET90_00075 [Candidatus Binatus sp.]|nr:hypothetical protein [Candidatus Binatus sp.]
MVQLVVLSSSLVGCGGAAGSPSPGESAADTTAPTPSVAVTGAPVPTLGASASPDASASPVATGSPEPSPSPAGWLTLLSLASCPMPRTADPACLDGDANGATPARTAAVGLGQDVRISATVHNAAPVVSPPITLLVFTFEPPMPGEWLSIVACNGCRIDPTALALQWPGLGPGDHLLTATLRVFARPSGVVGSDHEWLAAFFPLSSSAVLHLPDGIDTSLAFALATGETTILAK